MEKRMIVHIAKGNGRRGVVQYRKQTIRERILTRLLGKPCRVMLIVPDNSVKNITIQEVDSSAGRN